MAQALTNSSPDFKSMQHVLRGITLSGEKLGENAFEHGTEAVFHAYVQQGICTTADSTESCLTELQENSPNFIRFNKHEIEAMQEAASVRSYSQNVMVFEKGGPAWCVAVILQGSVRVFKTEGEGVQELTMGDLIGHQEFFESHSGEHVESTQYVQINEKNTVLMMFSHNALEELNCKHPKCVSRLMQILAEAATTRARFELVPQAGCLAVGKPGHFGYMRAQVHTQLLNMIDMINTKCTLLADVTPEEIDILMAHSQMIEYEYDEQVFQAHFPNSWVSLLVIGGVDGREGEGGLKLELGSPGHVFGEEAFLTQLPPLHVDCFTNSVTIFLVISPEVLARINNLEPELGFKLRRNITRGALAKVKSMTAPDEIAYDPKEVNELRRISTSGLQEALAAAERALSQDGKVQVNEKLQGAAALRKLLGTLVLLEAKEHVDKTHDTENHKLEKLLLLKKMEEKSELITAMQARYESLDTRCASFESLLAANPEDGQETAIKFDCQRDDFVSEGKQKPVWATELGSLNTEVSQLKRELHKSQEEVLNLRKDKKRLENETLHLKQEVHKLERIVEGKRDFELEEAREREQAKLMEKYNTAHSSKIIERWKMVTLFLEQQESFKALTSEMKAEQDSLRQMSISKRNRKASTAKSIVTDCESGGQIVGTVNPTPLKILENLQIPPLLPRGGSSSSEDDSHMPSQPRSTTPNGSLLTIKTPMSLGDVFFEQRPTVYEAPWYEKSVEEIPNSQPQFQRSQTLDPLPGGPRIRHKAERSMSLRPEHDLSNLSHFTKRRGTAPNIEPLGVPENDEDGKVGQHASLSPKRKKSQRRRSRVQPQTPTVRRITTDSDVVARSKSLPRDGGRSESFRRSMDSHPTSPHSQLTTPTHRYLRTADSSPGNSPGRGRSYSVKNEDYAESPRLQTERGLRTHSRFADDVVSRNRSDVGTAPNTMR